MKKVIYNNFILMKLYFKIDSKYIIFKLLLGTTQVIQPLTSVLLFRLFLDNIFVNKSFIGCVKILIIMTIANLISELAKILINNKMDPIAQLNANRTVIIELFNKYLSIDMKDLYNTNLYDKYVQVINDLPSRVISTINVISNFVGNLLSLITVIGLMFSMDPFLIIISIFCIVLNIYITPKINKLGYDSYLEKTKDNRIQEYIKRIFYMKEYSSELRLFHINKLFIKKYEESNKNLIEINLKYSNKYITLLFLLAITNILGFIGTLLYLAYMGLREVLSIGEVSALYNATEQLKSNALSFFSIAPKFIENSLYIDNYINYMSIDSNIENNNGKEIINIKNIKLNNVSFSYTDNDEDYTLNNINITINEKEKIAIVGHNGAGKSTFINLITRLYDPTSGDLYINNENYKDLDTEILRNNFLVIVQDSQIYATTIAQNILMRDVMDSEDEVLVVNALKKVGLYDKISTFKHGLYTVLTKEFDNDGILLSGGELQKIIVARVLVSKANIIILDEVTSNMDPLSEDKIYSEILQYAKDKIVIYISHKLSTAKSADKIYLFKDGKVEEEGTHEELINLGKYYKDMFYTQANKYKEIEELSLEL